MAFVDLNNNKIYGCKKGTLTWWHEKGHIEYNNSEFGAGNDFMRENFKNLTIITTLFSIPFNILFWFAFVFLLSWISFNLYEEAWCWRYAYKKMKGGKSNNGIQSKKSSTANKKSRA